MPLAVVTGEFGVVADPDFRISEKGNAWVKIRAVAKDRVRDSMGNWADGDPCFIDVIASGKTAENITESVIKGDSITVTGKLKQREYETDGVKRVNLYIDADIVGVSVRWGHAKTHRMIESQGGSGTAVAAEILGGTEITSEDAPF